MAVVQGEGPLASWRSRGIGETQAPQGTGRTTF